MRKKRAVYDRFGANANAMNTRNTTRAQNSHSSSIYKLQVPAMKASPVIKEAVGLGAHREIIICI